LASSTLSLWAAMQSGECPAGFVAVWVRVTRGQPGRRPACQPVALLLLFALHIAGAPKATQIRQTLPPPHPTHRLEFDDLHTSGIYR
jgi:hypothetical protein